MDISSLWQHRKALIDSTRPLTMVYTYAWVVVGYGNVGYSAIDAIVILNGLAAAFMVGCIMLHNDIVDAVHDCKKGKRFAFDHPCEMRVWRRLWCAAIIALLVLLATINSRVAFWTFAIWLVGMVYSFFHAWPYVPMVTVALCSASPVLLGPIAAGQMDLNAGMASAVLFAIIVLRELVKDLEDLSIDTGYKNTDLVRLAYFLRQLRWAKAFREDNSNPAVAFTDSTETLRYEYIKSARHIGLVCQTLMVSVILALKTRGIPIGLPIFFLLGVIEDELVRNEGAEPLNMAAVKKCYKLLDLTIVVTFIVFVFFPPY